MMNNLFSMFDPSSSFMSFAWSILALALAFHTIKLWCVQSPWMKAKSAVTETFKKEVKYSLNKTESGMENMILSLFLLILSLNFMALYPQIFSATSHLAINLPLSVSFWLCLLIFGWTKKTNHMLTHLLPQGTPGVLMSFMVLIELTSNLIRPITLCVRLTSNLIAGHLLMALLGNAMLAGSSANILFMSMAPITLTILESAVAVIQAYVFMTLITLYVAELK